MLLLAKVLVLVRVCIVESKNVCFGQECMICCWVCVFFAGVCVIA